MPLPAFAPYLPVLAAADGFWSYVYFILAFSLVIFVHELGHFAVAKFCGIKVERFSIGMPPRLIGIQIGETDYCIGMLPLGGFVKMLGEEPGENIPAEGQAQSPLAGDPRAFGNQSVGARAAVLSAGVIMNVIFAFILFIIIFNKGMDGMSTTVGRLHAEAPAARQRDAGKDSLRPGDVIRRVNGWGTEEYSEIMVANLLTDSDEPYEIEIERDGHLHKLAISRGKDPSKAKVDGRPIIGFEPAVSLKVPEAAVSGPLAAGEVVVATRAAAGEKPEPVGTFFELTRRFALNAGREMILTVRTPGGQTRDVTVSPRVGAEGGSHAARALFDGLSPRLKVTHVEPGSPGAEAGLRVGDVLLQINDVKLPSLAAVLRVIGETETDLTLVVARAGSAEPVDIKVAPRQKQWQRRGMVGFGYGHKDYDNFIIGEVAAVYGLTEETAGNLKRDGVPEAVAERLAPVRNRRFDSADALRAELSKLLDEKQLAAHETKLVRALAINRPARAGFAAGDVITAFDGRTVAGWNDWAREIAATAAKVPVRRGADEKVIPHPVAVEVRRGGEIVRLSVDVFPLDYELDALPVDIGVPWDFLRSRIQAHGMTDAVGMGLRKTHYMMMQIYATLRAMLTGKLAADNLSGPVGILAVGGKVARQDTLHMWYILAAISINLAVINFLPIPVLDGGHILFLIIEKIRGKPVAPETYDRVNRVGLMILLVLIVLVTYSDVAKLLR